MRRFLKKISEGNARNSRLINCADVTKIGKTRGSRSFQQNTRASHHARLRINALSYSKHVASSKNRKAIIKAVHQYYYADISPVEKGEVADSILYHTLDVFVEVLDHCSQNSYRVGHLYGWRSSEMKTVVLIGARIATD